MEKGYCNPFVKYSPALVAATALADPVEAVRTLARGAEVVTRLGSYAAGLALEASFGGPQDVEGCLPAGLEEEGRIWIVQARPQPGA